MDDAHDAEPEHSPYVRLPWPLVAGGLIGVLVLALAAGLFANRYLRPQLTVVPTPVPAAAAAAAAQAPPTAAAATVVSTPTLVPAPTPIVVAATAAPTATAPPPTLAASPTTVSRSVAPLNPAASAAPAVDPALAHEVSVAYERFWRVLSQALLDLDTTNLPEVMDGDYLVNTQQLINDLRTEGRAIKTQVVLSYSVVSTTSESSSVLDDVEDNSIYVNIGTEDPITSPKADQIRVVYRLNNLSGAWKVVDSVRSE